jgi:hypothetical protein
VQALEKIGVLEQDEDNGGRRITQSGQRDLDRKSRLHICLQPSQELTREQGSPRPLLHRTRKTRMTSRRIHDGVSVFGSRDLMPRLAH